MICFHKWKRIDVDSKRFLGKFVIYYCPKCNKTKSKFVKDWK